MNSPFFRPVEADPFLNEMASRYPDHWFLRNAIQGVYVRQAKFMAQRLGNGRVLDWGSGKGHGTYLLHKAGFEVTSADRGYKCREISQRLGTPFVDLPDQTELPFASGSFDAVVSFGVLEHVPDDLGSMREIRRILKPGGLFFVFFLPYTLSWGQRLAHARGDFTHDRLYSKRGVRALASEAGFEVEGIWHGQLFPKNRVRLPQTAQNSIEYVDRLLTSYTPLRYLATNLEAVLHRLP